MNSYRFICMAVLVTGSMLMADCKKQKNTSASPSSVDSPYNFTWHYETGASSSVSFYPFIFTPTVPAGATVRWSFGDGDTSASTSLTPLHVYHGEGSYTVTLLVNNDSARLVTHILAVYWWLPHAIYCAGTGATGVPIAFRSNVLPDSTFYWDFGDGASSTDSTPNHAYSTPGSFTVSLTVNGNASTKATCAVIVVNAPAFTAAMCTTRNYHDTAFLYSSGTKSAYPHANISMALAYIDPVTVSVFGRRLSCTFSSDSLLRFSADSVDNAGNDHSLTATYYHNNDSVVIGKYDRISAGGASGEDWESY